MRILTWNIQNSGTIDFNNPQIDNISNILQTINEVKADIVVLQEFQNEYYDLIVKNGLEKMGYICSVCKDDEEKTLRNRVLIAAKYEYISKERPKNIQRYSRRNWNEIVISDNKMAILGIDVPLAETMDIRGRKKDNRIEKKLFLDALVEKFKEYSEYDFPAIILGDFNLHEEAVYKEYLQVFKRYLLEITTEEATWGKHKFDYVFANSKMLGLVDKSKIFSPHSTNYSDHKYIYVELYDI